MSMTEITNPTYECDTCKTIYKIQKEAEDCFNDHLLENRGIQEYEDQQKNRST